MRERPRSDDAAERRSAAAERIAQQTRWVDLQVQAAVERGAFEDLPGLGKPITDLGAEHDPDWWVKKLVEREQITGVLPPQLLIRREDAELDGRLDRMSGEQEVRREVEEFNQRVRKALYTPPVDNVPPPPMITRQRDVEVEVRAWRARREERRADQRAALERTAEQQERSRRRAWWRRRRTP